MQVDKGVFLLILLHYYGKALLFTAYFVSLPPNFLHSKRTSNTKQNWTWQPVSVAPKQKLKMSAAFRSGGRSGSTQKCLCWKRFKKTQQKSKEYLCLQSNWLNYTTVGLLYFATSTCLPNTSRDADSTSSLGSLYQGLTAFPIKKFFLISDLNSPGTA